MNEIKSNGSISGTWSVLQHHHQDHNQSTDTRVLVENKTYQDALKEALEAQALYLMDTCFRMNIASLCKRLNIEPDPERATITMPSSDSLHSSQGICFELNNSTTLQSICTSSETMSDETLLDLLNEAAFDETRCTTTKLLFRPKFVH